MWGNLTERNNRTQTKFVSDPKELYRFLATPGIEVLNLMFSNDDVVWVSWKFTAEERVPNLLKENAIYCDSVSVIYIQPRDEPEMIETGDNLGDMTSELKPQQFITEFVSAGPKNYAYKIMDIKKV